MSNTVQLAIKKYEDLKPYFGKDIAAAEAMRELTYSTGVSFEDILELAEYIQNN